MFKNNSFTFCLKSLTRFQLNSSSVKVRKESTSSSSSSSLIIPKTNSPNSLLPRAPIPVSLSKIPSSASEPPPSNKLPNRNDPPTENSQNNSKRDTSNKIKIAICGAAGRLGQIVSLFLKQSPYYLDISLYDTATNLMVMWKQLDLVNTRNTISHFIGPIKMRQALKNADIVAILTQIKPNDGGQFNESLEQNLQIISSIIKCSIEVCPDAVIAVAAEPVNCMVAAISEIFQMFNVNSEDKVVGFSTIDSILASHVYARHNLFDSSDVFVPVVGGTSYETVVPLFSQGNPSAKCELVRQDFENLYSEFLSLKIQDLSVTSGFAFTRLVQSIVRGLIGERNIVECALVKSPEGAPVKYMNTLIDLGLFGVENVYGPPSDITKYEKKLLHNAFLRLRRDIEFAEKFTSSTRRVEASP